MAVQIILKNSTTEDKRPKTLANGEISLNYHADGAFLCCQDTEGNIQQVGGVKISTDAPDAPVKQTLWFNPDTLTLFIFDGDAWFPVGGAGGGGGGGDIIQIIGNDGIDADTIGGIVTLDVELAGGDDGLEFKTSKLSASIASETVLGSVKIGDNIDVSADGTISVDVPQTTTFRGSCILENPPLGQLAPNPPETGDAYINGVATDSIDNGWVNLGGGASAAGDLVIWDGAEWELIQTGGDSLWQRRGTTLEPTVDGDNIATTGKITSASTEDSDSGTTVVTKDYLGTALGNIPDTDNPANQPGTLDDRYVNVIGDNMTGDLTLGTDKITLDASNGNATFAGKATSASTEDTDSDTTLVTKDYLASEIAEGIDDLGAVTEITPGDGIDTRETDGDVTVSVYLAGTNDGLEFETGKLKATVATASELGSVMIGDGVNVDADGTISVPEAPSVTTSDTPPLAADSSNGDLWWNTNDGRLYIYYTDGDSSQWVDASPDSETELITNGPSFPTDAEVNDLFFNTTEGRLYIYFDDGNSQQWVDAAPQGSTGEGGGGGGDVERLVAGDNITLSPADGKGVVTISATGGGDGGPTTPGVRYQEGNWTPVFSSGSMNSPQAFWTRSGNTVFVTLDESWATIPSGTDEFSIHGLPYASNVYASGSLYVENKDTEIVAIPFTQKNENKIAVKGVSTKAAYTSTINVNNGFFKDGYLNITLVYTTDDTTFAPSTGSVVTEDIQGTGGSGGGTTVNYNGASAWASFNGDGADGAKTINASHNIASIIKDGAGTYNIVFTQPMPNADYAVTSSYLTSTTSKTSNGFTLLTFNFDGGPTSLGDAQFAVHAENAIAPQSGVGADAWGIYKNNTLTNGFNVKSFTESITGVYDVVFNVPMPTASYAVTATNDGRTVGVSPELQTTNGFRFNVRGSDTTLIPIDADYPFCFAVHASSTVTPTYTWTRDGTTLKPANDGDAVNINAESIAGLEDDIKLAVGEYAGTARPLGLFYTSDTAYQGPGIKVQHRNSTNSNAKFFQGVLGTNPTVELNADGTAYYYAPTKVGNNNVASWGSQDGLERITLKANGAAVFTGNVTAPNVFFNLEADDPANFSTEGEYTGPTLDVKELLLTLQTAAARIETLEAKVQTLEESAGTTYP